MANMNATTIFTNERKTFTTSIEGETLIMRGEATIGSENTNFNGQILRKTDGNYVGDYSTNNLSINSDGNTGYWIEAATLIDQLGKDVEAKKTELIALAEEANV